MTLKNLEIADAKAQGGFGGVGVQSPGVVEATDGGLAMGFGKGYSGGGGLGG